MIDTFQQMLDNIFEPLFEVTRDPSTHPQLHIFLHQVTRGGVGGGTFSRGGGNGGGAFSRGGDEQGETFIWQGLLWSWKGGWLGGGRGRGSAGVSIYP